MIRFVSAHFVACCDEREARRQTSGLGDYGVVVSGCVAAVVMIQFSVKFTDIGNREMLKMKIFSLKYMYVHPPTAQHWMLP